MSERKLPAAAVVLELVNDGMSTYEIARQFGVSRQAVQYCLRNNGVERAPKAQEYVHLDLPWRVRVAHNMDPEIRHLRALERMRQDLPVREEEQRQALNWAKMLIATDRVVAYSPDAGFYLVSRRPGEEGLVRR